MYSCYAICVVHILYAMYSCCLSVPLSWMLVFQHALPCPCLCPWCAGGVPQVDALRLALAVRRECHPLGAPMQRIAYYLSHALSKRMGGAGAEEYVASMWPSREVRPQYRPVSQFPSQCSDSTVVSTTVLTTFPLLTLKH